MDVPVDLLPQSQLCSNDGVLSITLSGNLLEEASSHGDGHNDSLHRNLTFNQLKPETLYEPPTYSPPVQIYLNIYAPGLRTASRFNKSCHIYGGPRTAVAVPFPPPRLVIALSTPFLKPFFNLHSQNSIADGKTKYRQKGRHVALASDGRLLSSSI